MLTYRVVESPKGSLFIVQSTKDNLYGLEIESRDIEEIDFDDDFLQDRIMEMAIAKLTLNDAQCIKLVTETCHKLFYETIAGKYSDKIIFITTESNAKSGLVELLVSKNKNTDLVHLLIKDIHNKNFYFIFNETKTKTVSVINAVINYIKKEYGISLSFGYNDSSEEEE